MEGKFRVKRRILSFCLSFCACAALAIGAKAQRCNGETYTNACLSAHPHDRCKPSGACEISVSKDPNDPTKAKAIKPDVCVDTRSYPTITWKADDTSRKIEIKFDQRDPTGTGTVPYVQTSTGSVSVTFANPQPGCYHYHVHYCKSDDTDCVDLDPKVIVNGSGGGGPKKK